MCSSVQPLHVRRLPVITVVLLRSLHMCISGALRGAFSSHTVRVCCVRRNRATTVSGDGVRHFCLGRYDWIGFDVDHTLIPYSVPTLELLFAAVIRHIREDLNVPLRWSLDSAKHGVRSTGSTPSMGISPSPPAAPLSALSTSPLSQFTPPKPSPLWQRQHPSTSPPTSPLAAAAASGTL